ncbi:MAG: adenylate/guanylate cyclase domain-containing protein [Candidatus Riflebacteria bacterium]|nr:adenylate/guanylate cyclase domain-containing protein [Candidatus Riflebacteria bacterium]
MSEQNIVIRRRVSAVTLLATWVMVFILPAFLVYLSLDYLFNLTLIAGKRAATASMTNEMDSFRRDLEMTSFLQRQLENYFAGLTMVPDWQNPGDAMNRLTSATGLHPVGLITHSADTLEIDYHMEGVLASEVKTLSRNLMRRYLVTLNQQHTHHFHSSQAEASTQALFRFVDPTRAKKDADLFFRRIFGLISEVPILPLRVTKSISSRLGGAVYFYYHPFISVKAGERLITGGQLLILRGSDIPWEKAARSATCNASTGMQRSFAAFEHSMWESGQSLQEIATRFYEDKTGYHFVSTLSQCSLVDLIQGGSLIPYRLQQVVTKMPLLKVSMPWSELQHPLLPWLKHIIFALRLYMLFGALLVLRFFFFGIEFRAGIGAKVVIGTVFILLLPITLLVVGFVTWQQFHQVYDWYEAETRHQQVFADFSNRFNAYLATLQQQTFDLSVATKKLCLRNDKNDFGDLFANWLKTSIAVDISLDRPLKESIKVKSTTQHSPELPEEESTRRLSASLIINAFDAADNFNKVFNDSDKRSINSVEPSFINEMIARWGKLYMFSSFNIGSRFSSVYIHKPGKNSPMAILTLKFNNETILRDFVTRSFKLFNNFADIDCQYFLIRKDSGALRFYNLSDESEIVDPRQIARLNLAVTSGQCTHRLNNRDLVHYFAMSEYPLVLFARSNNVAGRHANPWFISLLMLYALLLLLFIFLVFMLIYLRPIREFIRVTEAVAAGDYQQKVALTQTDEFGDLKTTFDEMIQGLEQRRRLSHFVSSEVIKAVESDSEESMAVGGERIEATVTFVQLEKLQHFASDATAEEIFAILDEFIAVADNCASLHGGVVDKLIEDTLMLVFRASPERQDHAVAASTAVLSLAEIMRSRGLRICAGIASGIVVSGRIGSRLGKLDFTVIGDTVNLAARLKAEAKKAVNTGIIISPGAIRILKGRARVTFIERTEIKGKSREYPLYELTALRQ